MTKKIAEKIVKGITDKIECNTADIDDWAEFWGFTREEYEEFLDIAIKALEQQNVLFKSGLLKDCEACKAEQQPCYNPDEWCHDCSEYNHDKHCCPRYNKVIRNAVEEIKQPKTHWISYWDEEARCYVYKCPECGNKQPFDTKHCWECGTKLSEISTGSESEKT